MRRNTVLWFSVMLVTAAMLGAQEKKNAENLVGNPGFSEGMKGWIVGSPVSAEKQYPDHPGISVTVDETVSRDKAGKSLKATRDVKELPLEITVSSENFPVKAKTDYEVSLWARTDTPGLKLRLLAESYEPGLTPVHWYRVKTASLASEWQKVSMTVTPETDRPFHVRIDLFRESDPKTSGTLWVDDVEFKVFDW